MTKARSVPSADACVLRPLLEAWSARWPENVFVKLSKDK